MPKRNRKVLVGRHHPLNDQIALMAWDDQLSVRWFEVSSKAEDQRDGGGVVFV